MATTLFIVDKIDFAAQLLADAVNYLDAEALCRFEKIKVEQDKLIFALSRKILKLALAYYHPQIDKNRWIFARNHFGKPFINGPKLPAPLYFNLSHSVDAIAVAISDESEVGVDIERVRPLDRSPMPSAAHINISQSYFTENEHHNLVNLPYEEGFRLFWKLWTAKEAYLKQRGMGLSLGLNAIDINYLNNSILTTNCDDKINLHQWSHDNLIIALSAAKSVNEIALFRYDDRAILHPIKDFAYTHN